MNGTERIRSVFSSHSKVLMGYLMAGDGGLDKTVESAIALIEGGATLLELGFPFSDPVADGVVIQKASERALKSGIQWESYLSLVARIRNQSNVPLILFSYLNPLLSALRDAHFLSKARQAGVDGILVVDCSFEVLADFQNACILEGIALIPIITPATSLLKIQEIDQKNPGFLYYACRKGVTGLKRAFPSDFSEKLKEIRRNVISPVIVGFGISDQKMAVQACEYADGIVVGSLFVKAVEEGASFDELRELANQFCVALKNTVVSL